MRLHRVGLRVVAGRAQLDAAAWDGSAGACRTWLLRLTSDEDTLDALWPLLADDERARANAFQVSSARNQFVQARGALRLLLARFLGVSATQIAFVYGEFGKPALARGGDWRFNVAHSGEYALLTLSNGREVGVDIERLNAPAELVSLVNMVLSPAEAAAWQTLPADRRLSAFFAVWTAKEAVAKAVGQGLGLDFPGLDIGLACDCTHTGMRRVTAGGFGACRLAILPAPPGYAAALAVRATDGAAPHIKV